ncbi:MAG: GNAT family N-acetyltransferase [Chloroflexota bacterium]
MPLTREQILDALDSRLFLSAPYPETVSVPIDVEGVLGQKSAMSAHAESNFVGFARLTETNVDATIKAVREAFGEHDFIWVVSDRSTPQSLADKLLEAGFVPIFDLVGMVLIDLQHSITPNPKITVRIAQASDKEAVNYLYREAYPLPDAEAEARYQQQLALNGRDYLAYLEGVDEPIAVASMYYDDRVPVVTLQGAATLPDYRGQGTYTALVAKRLNDARADGIQVAVTQAMADTSAPIVAKLGFQKWMDMTGYASPSET